MPHYSRSTLEMDAQLTQKVIEQIKTVVLPASVNCCAMRLEDQG